MTHDEHDDRLLIAVRQTLHDPARALTPPEDPVRWVRGRVRRQRAGRGLALLTVLALMAAGVTAAVAIGRDAHVQQLAVAPAPVAVPRPASYLAHLQGGTGAPGTIEEVDTATGTTLHTLGQAYDPYLMNGFTVDRRHQHLYYTVLNEPAQSIDIVDQPVAGGPPVVLGHGTALRVSPDDRWLAYLTSPADLRSTPGTTALTVRDLHDGRQRALALPLPAQDAQIVWLADARLLLLQRPPSVASSCPISESVVPCPRSTPTDPTTHLFRLDPRTPSPAWNAVGAATRQDPTEAGPAPTAWQSYRLLAAAPDADQVRVTSGADTSTVLTVRLADGAPTDRLDLPTGTEPQGFDASGQHPLFSTSPYAGTESSLPQGTYTLDNDGQPQRLGRTAAEAAW